MNKKTRNNMKHEEWEEKLLEYIFRIFPVAYFPNPIPPMSANQEMLVKEMNNYILMLIQDAINKDREEIVGEIQNIDYLLIPAKSREGAKLLANTLIELIESKNDATI